MPESDPIVGYTFKMDILTGAATRRADGAAALMTEERTVCPGCSSDPSYSLGDGWIVRRAEARADGLVCDDCGRVL